MPGMVVWRVGKKQEAGMEDLVAEIGGGMTLKGFASLMSHTRV